MSLLLHQLGGKRIYGTRSVDAKIDKPAAKIEKAVLPTSTTKNVTLPQPDPDFDRVIIKDDPLAGFAELTASDGSDVLPIPACPCPSSTNLNVFGIPTPWTVTNNGDSTVTVSGLSNTALGLTDFQTPSETLQDVIDQLQSIISDDPGTPLADKVEDALGSVQTALRELDKAPSDNQAAIGNMENGVGDLEVAVTTGLLDSQEGKDLMDKLAGAARQLASEAIGDATFCDPDHPNIALAQQALNDGDVLRTAEAFKDAVNAYKDALSTAEGVPSC